MLSLTFPLTSFNPRDRNRILSRHPALQAVAVNNQCLLMLFPLLFPPLFPVSAVLPSIPLLPCTYPPSPSPAGSPSSFSSPFHSCAGAVHNSLYLCPVSHRRVARRRHGERSVRRPIIHRKLRIASCHQPVDES